MSKRTFLALVLAALPLPAASQTWSGANFATSTNWSDPLNWVGGVAPVSGNTTQIDFALGAASGTSVVDAPFTLNRLTTSGMVFNISGNALTFDGASPMLRILAFSNITNPIVFNTDVIVESDSTFTLGSGGLFGAGGFTKTGTGPVILPGSISLAGTITVSDGTLQVGTGATGPLQIGNLVNNSAIEFCATAGGTTTVGSLSGTGSVRVTCGLLLQAGGAFTHSGTTTVDQFRQFDGDVNGPGALLLEGALNTNVSSVGSLTGGILASLNASGPFTTGSDNTDTAFYSQIIGNGPFIKVGSGRQLLGGAIGVPITLSGGTIAFGDGFTAPGSVPAVTNNAAMEVNTAGTLLIPGGITGSGTVTVIKGTLDSSSPMAHAGTTTVNAAGFINADINNSAPLVLDGSMTPQVSTSIGSLSGSGFLHMLAPLTTGSDNTDATYTGVMGDFAPFTKVGTGRQTLVLVPVGFAGTTTIAGGTLRLGDGVAGTFGMAPIINNASLEFAAPSLVILGLSGSGNLTVSSGLSSCTNPLSHTGTTTVNAGAQLNAAISNGGRLTLDGTMVSNQSTTVGSLVGSGTIAMDFGTTLFTGGDGSTATFSGSVTGGGSMRKEGSGRLTLSGANTLLGSVLVDGGGLAVTGSVSSPVIVFAGTLLGTGTVGDVFIGAGSTLAPGLSPGVINTGNLALFGTLAQEIFGATLGTQYDSINVTGTVDVTGATLAISGPYVPLPGNTFTIINNDGVDPVVGTFVGLPEGATVVINGVNATISYVGGTGNDVVLAVAPAPAGIGGGPIPTLSQWMLVLLAFVTLTLGLRRTRSYRNNQ